MLFAYAQVSMSLNVCILNIYYILVSKYSSTQVIKLLKEQLFAHILYSLDN